MDTRVWGKDLWPILHLICHGYDATDSNAKQVMVLFLQSLPYVLPCIYCRRSLASYFKQLPLTEEILSSCAGLSKWMYDIHNLVNDKLRKQHLLSEQDPTYEEISAKYDNMISAINRSYCSKLNGWKALYAIATVYPALGVKSIECLRWSGYFTFFTFLPYVIPFRDLRDIMLQYTKSHALVPALSQGRTALQQWLHGLEKHVAAAVQDSCETFEERCAEAERIRAGCGSKRDKIPTCRQRRS